MRHPRGPWTFATLAVLLGAPAAAEPPTEFVYVTNYADGTVSGFRVDADTGALTEVTGSPFAAAANPNDLAIDPTNRFLYVIHGDSTVLTGFAIGGTGALTPLPGSPFTAFPPSIVDMWAGTVDPSGRFLYATDALHDKLRGYLIDPANGALSPMPGSGFPLGGNGDGVCVDPGGRFAFAGTFGGPDGLSAFTIAPMTGALTRVMGTPVSPGSRPMASAVDPSGRYLFVANGALGSVSSFAIHPDTGYPGLIAGLSTGDFPTGVAVTPSGRFVYVANSGTSNSISAFALDAASGTLSPVAGAPFDGDGGPTEVAIDPANRFLYAANRSGSSVSAFTIAADGALAEVVGSPYDAGFATSAIAMTSHDPIFADGFETGDLAPWSSASTDGGDLTASAAAALHGTHGLSALVDDTAPLFVTDETPADEDRYRARFLIRTNGYDPGTGQGHLRTRVLIALGTGGLRPRVFALVLRLREGTYALSARVLLDDGTRAETPFVPITDVAPHAIQLDWRRASSPDAADGSFELFVDDVSVAALTGLDNHAAGIDGVRIGAMAVKTGASGELRFDRFESKRYNFIWPGF